MRLRSRPRPKPAPTKPQPAPYDSYRDRATHGVAVNLNAEHLDAMGERCLALAAGDYEADGAKHRAIARSLLAGALRDWCEEIASSPGDTPLNRHLVQVGLGQVDWDGIAGRVIA